MCEQELTMKRIFLSAVVMLGLLGGAMSTQGQEELAQYDEGGYGADYNSSPAETQTEQPAPDNVPPAEDPVYDQPSYDDPGFGQQQGSDPYADQSAVEQAYPSTDEYQQDVQPSYDDPSGQAGMTPEPPVDNPSATEQGDAPVYDDGGNGMNSEY
jgi:hypothetical protein